VTQEQFARIMKRNPSWFQKDGDGRDDVRNQDPREFPVEMVSWDDAVEFCRRLSELSAEKEARRVYRLPTEAEWEYACRAGSATEFSTGAALNVKQANVFERSSDEKSRPLDRSARVGSYAPNAWGFFDLHGNVFEWCSDWYDAGYYARAPAKDPSGPESGTARVLRGGAWCYLARHARSAARNAAAANFRSYFIGFRVATTPP
jgi:formylglycine-generating enzyme required for sulfatase activity